VYSQRGVQAGWSGVLAESGEVDQMISTVIVHDEAILNEHVYARVRSASNSATRGSASDCDRMEDVTEDVLNVVCAVVHAAVGGNVFALCQT
jgi:hypothetical protein